MTQLTPEELAACREAYCKEYGYDPEWDVVIDEDFQKAFSAGLFHKQAESAKEIAALKAQVEGFRKELSRLSIGQSTAQGNTSPEWMTYLQRDADHPSDVACDP
jgi:predicted phage tail protein